MALAGIDFMTVYRGHFDQDFAYSNDLKAEIGNQESVPLKSVSLIMQAPYGAYGFKRSVGVQRFRVAGLDSILIIKSK